MVSCHDGRRHLEEIDGAGLMRVAFGRDDFAGGLGVRTVLPEEVVEELIEAVTALRRDVGVIARGDFKEVALEKCPALDVVVALE